ncbi:MAG: class I mannose-6-phosphate isomerase [Treponema sp.]|nr:class I mannose-6-phosphate isomerase [Treponema sp.]
MKMNPIILKPKTKTLIWGTEQWGISAHPNGDDEVLNEEYSGKTLSALWKENPELFGNVQGDRFPLLTKIIDTNADLSIQVHPDDDYASKNENGSLGKTECWYIMDAKPKATIVIGHNAKNSDEVRSMIENGRWSDFIREVPIKKGDFFFIEPGTVHAIKGETVILETQQSSDITYRVYDYDRLQDGRPRQLHVKQSIDVITAPFVQKKPPLDDSKTIGAVKQLVSSSFFTVWHGVVEGELEITQNQPFLLCSVINGTCSLDNHTFAKGDHFILPNNYGRAIFKGNAEIIFSSL